MKHKRLAVTITAAAAVAGAFVATSGSANATAPVYLTDPNFGNSVYTEAINVQASGGILTVAPTLDTVCAGPTPAQRPNLAELTLGTLADVKALHGECNIAPLTDLSEAKAKIASISLLNGAIKATGINSKCSITRTGAATCGSTVATLNGKDVTIGPLSIVLPGLAAVYFDQNTEVTNPDGSVTMRTRALEVDLFPVVVAGHVTRQAEQVVVGEASITSPGGID